MADHDRDEALLAALPLAQRVASGDAEAFRELMLVLWEPSLRLIGGSAAMRGLGTGDDEVREVVTRLMAKLERDDFRALKLYADWQPRHPDKTFADWFKITAANVVRDFGRERRGSDRQRVSGELSKKRLLNDFAKTLPGGDELGLRPAMTDAQTARQLLAFARDRLAPDQLAALEAWLEGASYATIASSRGLAEAAAAKRLVRAAVAVLRREFATSGKMPPPA
ncbi:MAG: hypothetical protein R3B72_01195 [Polyangiaceae bacterium]